MRAETDAALGLIAGEGSLPLAVTRAARDRGRRVVAIAFHDSPDRRLDAEAAQVTWLHPGEVEAALEALRAAGVREAVLAGKVDKAMLYAERRRCCRSFLPARGRWAASDPAPRSGPTWPSAGPSHGRSRPSTWARRSW